jgi:tRNA pseudouridine38-40 synthase
LNYYLPGDVAVKAAYRKKDAFNVRRDAVSREYSYLIWNSPVRSPLLAGRAHQVPVPLDIEAAGQAGEALIGTHDFASFISGDCSGLKSMVRRVFRAGLEKDGDRVIFRVEASSFLPHQVRNTVGTLVRVGSGKMSVAEFKSIIETPKPGAAWPTAPAAGLCLERVNYGIPLGEVE